MTGKDESDILNTWEGNHYKPIALQFSKGILNSQPIKRSVHLKNQNLQVRKIP